MIVFLVLSVILNVVVIYGIWNADRKMEILEEEGTYLENTIEIVTNNIINTLGLMRDIDATGHFESDDEVGIIFKSLHQILTENLGIDEQAEEIYEGFDDREPEKDIRRGDTKEENS